MSTDPLHPQASALARALTELAAAHGLVFPAGEVDRRLAQCRMSGVWEEPADPAVAESRESIESPESTELHLLQRCAMDLGLRAKPHTASLQDVLADVDHGRPATLAHQDSSGSLRWLIVSGVRGGSVKRAWIGDESRDLLFEWISQSELRSELGAELGDPLDWMLVDPTSPASGAASAGHNGEAPHPLRRLLHFLRPDRGDLWAVVAFSVATGVLLLATPVAVQALVNFVALGGTPSQVIVVALLLFLGLGLAGVVTSVQTWVVEILQRRIFVRTVAELSSRLPRVQLDAPGSNFGPELVNRFFDVITIQKVSANLLLDGLGIVLSVVVGLTVVAFYHPILLAFDILLIVAILLIVLGPLQRGIRTATKESSAKYAMEAWFEELAGNTLLFKSGGSRRWALERSDYLAAQYVHARKGHFRVVFGQVIGALTLQVIANTALLGIGGMLVMQGSLTLGQLVAAELIVTIVVSSVAKLGKHVESFYDLMAAVNKVGVLLDLPLEPSGEERYKPAVEEYGATLSLKDVAYLRENGEPLFDSISMEVPSGGSLGVTGPSGAGKSALAQLIWHLREPSRGVIQLDGHDLRSLHVESLRHLVTVASHTSVVEATLEENVRLHRVFVSDDDLHKALSAVELVEAVGRLPEEKATVLRRDGHPLSHGEIARLLLARAIAGRPRLLVVDGLLDSLEQDLRAQLCRTLFAKDTPWTLVVISNEADVLAHCDQILRLGEGGSGSSAA